jgi:amino acid transporter
VNVNGSPVVAPSQRKITLLPLIAATYFMVSGGPYGLEDLIAKAGYRYAMLALLVTPFMWGFPTALMVGELSAALPEEGGYYAWVRRALGPFWGFQEAWLSLAASVFDMAIYPTLFVLYLGKLVPAVGSGWAATGVGAAVIALSAAWNVLGAQAVGEASLGLTIALLLPFVLLSIAAVCCADPVIAAGPSRGSHPALLGGILVAMWNYMGWDNASTVAAEVDRPQRTYPLAMIGAVSLVAITYLIPVGAMWWRGLDPSAWSTGAWVDAATAVGGRWLGVAVVTGGMVCGVGMFNALIMSYSRLPLVLARDGFLPRFVATPHPRTGAPWVAITLCAVAYAACLGLGFERLVELDVTLYGLSLLLEFVALVALRAREPLLARPFRVPGGLAGAVAVGVAPMGLLALALLQARAESTGPNGFWLSGGLILAGPALYFSIARLRPGPGLD